MTNRIPIYQMTFGQDSDGKQGLVFTTEQEEYGNQSVLFVIPIADNFHHPIEFITYFERSKVVFPFQLGDKYFDLEGRINFPEVTFRIPETDIKITFEIDNENIWGRHIFSYRKNPYRNMKYVGKQKHLVVRNNGFIVLQPVDLYEMDELYLKYKGIFVGLTPNFGNNDTYDRQ